MPNLNQVNLIGHLTRDVEVRHTQSSIAIANVGLAINSRWKNKSGEQQEETTFVDCDAWGRTAEVLAQYVRKGDPLFVSGRLKLDQWEDKEGRKQSKIKVVIENFQFLKGKEDATPAGRGVEALGTHKTTNRPADIDENDIPF